MYGEGISRVGELLDLAVMADVVKKSGAWFSYKENRLGQGRDKVKELFKNDPALAKEIEEETLKHKDELLGQISKSQRASLLSLNLMMRKAQKLKVQKQKLRRRIQKRRNPTALMMLILILWLSNYADYSY